MTAKSIRNVSLSAIATVACLAGANSVRADHYNHGHNHGCSSQVGYPVYGYRPIQTLPYYGYAGNGYSGYTSNYGGYNNFSGGYGVGGYPIGSSYGGGSFPRGGSYGGGGFPSGASFGGGAFPHGGSYGGGGFSLYIGR